MHGRPRKSATPVDENASALKAAKIRSLQSQFLHNHHNKIYTKEALEINAKLIEANPEFMTAWNYRKLAFEHNLSSQSEDEKGDSDYIKAIIDEELRVVETALRKNFKSYGAWHHRKWVVSKGNSSTERELKLLNMFQKQDTRNFHAWNYRRFIAGLKSISEEKELQFTTDMINDNFSNYSAWHNRSHIGVTFRVAPKSTEVVVTNMVVSGGGGSGRGNCGDRRWVAVVVVMLEVEAVVVGGHEDGGQWWWWQLTVMEEVFVANLVESQGSHHLPFIEKPRNPPKSTPENTAGKEDLPNRRR
ncbi:hypothetical protein OSB04_003784 [Centaurea solstitialis]|uniref:Geranylgeranyl transferase type-2 subunit alpha n=1 Tax=Centaurea solstitialis TaxID=347529 RepID=A0AA38UD04_9ASTR|nr:hypothetical protein OSB04_003784 [Centaurea solstitialis]